MSQADGSLNLNIDTVFRKKYYIAVKGSYYSLLRYCRTA